MSAVRWVLFLCTGNYYRSRFAELLFNALAAARGLPWRAFSRGLALEKGRHNRGPMAPVAVEALRARGIPLQGSERPPRQVSEDDLRRAALIVALEEAEHRPYLQARYPAWAERVVYWHVRDTLPQPQYNPLDVIEAEVRGLVAKLEGEEEPPCSTSEGKGCA